MIPSRVAVVTGGGSGIGRVVALALLKDGWQVIVAGRTLASLEETGRLAGEAQSRAVAHPTDVTDRDSVGRLFEAVKHRCGRLDLLFNNAGISVAGNIGDLSFEDWSATLDTNLTGAFLCAQGAFRLMRDQQPCGGRIINNGSVSAHAPRPNSAAYTTTKHAITGLTRSISLDGRAYGIACGQIDIGNARTSMASQMQSGVQQADGRIAIEPVMDVEAVARAVKFMASLPLDANVQEMILLATSMPFVGRG